MNIEELQDILKNAGVAGAGGAGFPTYAKIDGRAKTVLLNCAECEPLLKLHRQLLCICAEEIVRAFALVVDTVGADEGIIAVKSEYRETLTAVRAAVSRIPKLRVHELPGAYPMGDEVVLIYEAAGIAVPPGGLPIQSGVAVFNVETMYNIGRAVFESAPVTDKLVTVAGEVASPVTVRVPLGTPLEELVRMAGGAVRPDVRLLVGGPMMGRAGSGEEPVIRTTNAVLVLPEDHYLFRRMDANIAVQLKRAASVCCQCRMCTDLCPRHALGHPITPHLFMRSAANRDFRDTSPFLDTFFCSSCGVCELYACPQSLSPRTLIAAYKNGLRKNGVKAPENPVQREVSAARDLRRVPEERLAARLGISAYDVPAPVREIPVRTDIVRIRLQQHIGAPAVPAVRKGDRVIRGGRIADAAQGLSLPVHASVSGTVRDVTPFEIVIVPDGQ